MRLRTIRSDSGDLTIDLNAVHAVRWVRGAVQSHPAYVEVLTFGGWKTIATWTNPTGHPDRDASAQEFYEGLIAETWPNDTPPAPLEPFPSVKWP